MKNNQLTELGHLLISLFQYLFFALAIFTIIAGFYLANKYLFLIVIIPISFLAFTLLQKKIIKLSHFRAFIFVFTLVLGFLMICLLKTPIISDFKAQYKAALALKNGSFYLHHNAYFDRWPYQLGLSIYES
ncbi:hypothetical protein EQ500_12380 [Lactobacillus sp. XV13L]|nr:hypothetical protein [Lactobacillus sp. XV13L]